MNTARIVVLGLALACPALAEGNRMPDKKIVYKKVGDVELKLHVFVPAGHTPSDRRPAIVFFFGGGWTGGDPAQFFGHGSGPLPDVTWIS